MHAECLPSCGQKTYCSVLCEEKEFSEESLKKEKVNILSQIPIFPK